MIALEWKRDEPLPWERSKMTICIAAACMTPDGEDPRLVMCTDWRRSGFLGSADTAFKMRRLPRHDWYGLTSGNEPDIAGLWIHLRQRFRSAETLDETNVGNLLSEALLARKKEKASALIAGRFGISYDDFLNYGKQRLPEEVFRVTMLNIADLNLGAELLICGFTNERQPMIYRTNNFASVRIYDDYAAVGEGEYLASAVLLSRRQSAITRVNETLYNVFEAKKYAESVPSVGEFTTITILGNHGERQRVTSSGKDWLDKMYREFGPKNVGILDEPPDGIIEVI